MSDKNEYSPGAVTKMLAIPPSSLRRYVAIYEQYFSPGARLQQLEDERQQEQQQPWYRRLFKRK